MDIQSVPTTCPYCGSGCGLCLQVMDGRIIGTLPVRSNPTNHGKLCIKGWNVHEFVSHPDRLKKPLIRHDDSFREVAWDEALGYAAGELRRIRDSHGSDSIGVITSARCTNEENYLLQKLARAVIGTNNVDHCARLCHGPTVAGLSLAFGSGAMTSSFDELEDAHCIFAIGSNTTVAHPVVATRLIKAREKGHQLIVADPRKTHLAHLAHIHIQHRLGTDVALINGLMHIIYKNGWHNRAFIDERTENFDALVQMIEKYPPKRTSEITGVDEATLVRVAELYAAGRSSSSWTPGTSIWLITEPFGCARSPERTWPG